MGAIANVVVAIMAMAILKPLRASQRRSAA
jgi:hypothetical protein